MIDEAFMKGMREKIDGIDKVLINALVERFSLVPEIAEYKKINELPISDEDREATIMKHIKDVAKKNGLNESFVEEIFLSIFNESKRLQQEFIEKD